jgi:hypothetical protein
MLSLDDSLWSRLQHAYGDASDIPTLLRSLAASPGPAPGSESEPWHSLWSRLCHQGDAYSASYAAVPHLVRIACETAAPVDFSFFLLPASIEVARQHGRGPKIPADIAESYRHALARIGDCVSIHRSDPWDQSMTLSVAAAQAAAKGHIDVAEALLNLDDDWIARIIADER